MRTKKLKKEWNLNVSESRLAGCTGAAVMLVSKQNNPMSDEIIDIVEADRKFTLEKKGRTRLQLTYAIDGADSQCHKCKQWIACRSQLARHRAQCENKDQSEWKYKFARNSQGNLFCYFGCGIYELKIDLLIHLQQFHTTADLKCFGISDTALSLSIFKLQDFDPNKRPQSQVVQSIDSLVELAAQKDTNDLNQDLDWLDVAYVKPSFVSKNLASKVTNLSRNKDQFVIQDVKGQYINENKIAHRETIQNKLVNQKICKQTVIYNIILYLEGDNKPYVSFGGNILQDANLLFINHIANDPPQSFQSLIEILDEGIQIYGDWYINCTQWASITDPYCAERLIKEIKCVTQLTQESDTHPIFKYLPLKMQVWKTQKHIVLAYKLPPDSMNMINLTNDGSIELAMKLLEKLKDDLPNIHEVVDYMGDLTVKSIYYDKNTEKITFVDWSNYQPKIKVHGLNTAGRQLSNEMFVSYPATGQQDKWRILWLLADCISLRIKKPNLPLPSQSYTDYDFRHSWAHTQMDVGLIHQEDERISFEMLMCRAVDTCEDQVMFAHNIELAWHFIDFNPEYTFSSYEERTVAQKTLQQTDNNEETNDITRKRDEKLVTKTISWSDDTADYRDKMKYYHLKRQFIISQKRQTLNKQENIQKRLKTCLKQ